VAVGNTQQTVDLTGGTSVQVGTAPSQGGQGGLLVLQGTNLGRYTRNEFSVVPEVGLTLGYQVTSWCRATVGYNFLYWTNVLRPGGTIDRGVNATYQPFSPIAPGTSVGGALAGDPARPAPIFNSTDFWAQGLTLGLEFRW
jgi:Putative beta barrel porin-7 (BBP7)